MSQSAGIPTGQILSIGLTCIYLAKELYPNSQIYITGFDSYKTGLYFETSINPLPWRPNKIQMLGKRRRVRYHRNKQDNDWHVEQELLLKMKTSGEIIYI